MSKMPEVKIEYSLYQRTCIVSSNSAALRKGRRRMRCFCSFWNGPKKNYAAADSVWLCSLHYTVRQRIKAVQLRCAIRQYGERYTW